MSDQAQLEWAKRLRALGDNETADKIEKPILKRLREEGEALYERQKSWFRKN